LDAMSSMMIADQLLQAIGYAHSQGVVHRDLKPDNIFVTSDGRVKIADFGIAHVGSSATLTQAGTIMGTPGYMSPEQVTGASIDGRSDLFSIGVITIEMLSGSNPFGATDGTPGTTVMYRVVHEDIPNLPALELMGVAAYVPAALAVATAKNPDARFADAALMRGALAGQPFQAGAVGPGAAAATVAWGVDPKSAAGSGGQGMSTNTMLILGVSALGVLAVMGMFVMSGGIGPTRGGGGVSTSTVEATSTPSTTGPPPVKTQTKSTPPRDLSQFARLTATSTNPVEGWRYGVSNLIDNRPSTCWEEGVRGYGEGESITFGFPRAVTVSKVQMIPGYVKIDQDANRWFSNGRVAAARVQFSDGTSEVWPLNDDYGATQNLTIAPPKKTTFVRVTILKTYSADTGTTHDSSDTSISELHVIGTTN
ncbi:MAG: protein kinase, partial [Actinomycetes bacterium]